MGYQVLVIRFTGKGKGVLGTTRIFLFSSHSEVLEWAMNETHSVVDSAQWMDANKDFNGGVFFGQLHKLQNKDFEVTHHLLKAACDQGWMPFGIDTPEAAAQYDAFTIKLRRQA